MNKFYKLLFITILSVIIVLLSCQNFSSGSSDNKKPKHKKTEKKKSSIPSKVFISNPKSLFVSKSALYELSSDGSMLNTVFIDQYGKAINLNVLNLIQINKDYIGMVLSYDGITYTVIGNKDDGILLDISSYYSLSQLGTFNNKTIRIIGNNLYLLSNTTIYKIDLTTRVATAINNPEYNKAGWNLGPNNYGDNFIIVNDNNVITCVDIGGSWPIYIFFNNNNPPLNTKYAGEYLSNVGGGNCKGLLIGDDGYLYKIATSNKLEIIKLTFNSLGITENVISIDNNYNNNGVGFFWTRNYDLYAQKRYVVCQTGFYTITRNSVTGGFDLAFTAKDFSALNENMEFEGKIKISLDTLYYKDGDTIKYFNLLTDNTFNNLVTASNIINWWVVNGSVIYTAYITGTNIGTFKVENGNSVLISNSDMEIQNIVEFTL